MRCLIIGALDPRHDDADPAATEPPAPRDALDPILVAGGGLEWEGPPVRANDGNDGVAQATDFMHNSGRPTDGAVRASGVKHGNVLIGPPKSKRGRKAISSGDYVYLMDMARGVEVIRLKGGGAQASARTRSVLLPACAGTTRGRPAGRRLEPGGRRRLRLIAVHA